MTDLEKYLTDNGHKELRKPAPWIVVIVTFPFVLLGFVAYLVLAGVEYVIRKGSKL